MRSSTACDGRHSSTWQATFHTCDDSSEGYKKSGVKEMMGRNPNVQQCEEVGVVREEEARQYGG